MVNKHEFDFQKEAEGDFADCYTDEVGSRRFLECYF